MKDVAGYLQPIKEEVLENVSKRKIEGGLNLINLMERIDSLKIKQILEADTQIPETDNIYTNKTGDCLFVCLFVGLFVYLFAYGRPNRKA